MPEGLATKMHLCIKLFTFWKKCVILKIFTCIITWIQQNFSVQVNQKIKLISISIRIHISLWHRNGNEWPLVINWSVVILSIDPFASFLCLYNIVIHTVKLKGVSHNDNVKEWIENASIQNVCFDPRVVIN